MYYGLCVCEFNENMKKNNNMDRIEKKFSYNFGQTWYFSDVFGIQLNFDMYCDFEIM